MKRNNLIYTILYMGFVLLNILVVTIGMIMITLKGNELADAGAILLFLEAMVFLSLKRKSLPSSQEY